MNIIFQPITDSNPVILNKEIVKSEGIKNTNDFISIAETGEFPFNKLSEKTIQSFSNSLEFDKNQNFINANPSDIYNELSEHEIRLLFERILGSEVEIFYEKPAKQEIQKAHKDLKSVLIFWSKPVLCNGCCEDIQDCCGFWPYSVCFLPKKCRYCYS